MAELRVELLGPPRVEVDGAPLEVDTRKAIALLARLVVTGTERRGALTGLLWPNSDESRARAALRRTLSALNVGLGNRWLVTERDEVHLAGDGVSSDVETFTRSRRGVEGHQHEPTAACAACLESLETAVAQHRGEFLAGFTLRDSAAFDDWCLAQRERLHRNLCETLDRLIAIHTRRGDLDAAAEHARRRLASEPLHEPTHRRLMLLHAWRGQRGQAMQQYRQCVAVLERELGVPPLERTTELHQAIVAGHTPEPPPPAPLHGAATRPRTPQQAPPLVGRDEAAAQLRAAHDAAERHGQLVVIEGEAGIGKTRLVEALADEAADTGAPTVTIHCYEEEQPIAYGVVAELLRATATRDPQRTASIPDSWLREAGRLAPELIAERPELAPREPIDSAESRRRFLEALRQVIGGGLTGALPGLVVIDDVHWADQASQDALAYLLHRLTDLPLCLVLTWRSELMPPGQPLRRLAEELDAAGNGTRVELDRLGPDEIVQLADSMQVALDDDVTAWLVRESEGLPLFAVEYLRRLAEGADADLGDIPEGIRRVAEERLARTSDAARQILSAAAVIGRSFDVDTLVEASGRDDEESVDALEELAAADVIAEVGGEPPAYDFRNEKLRTIVYEQTSTARRRLLHGRVADALTSRRRRSDGQPFAGSVARHLRLAGREAEAAHAHATAAATALDLSAHTEAREHLKAALDLGHPDPGPLHAQLGDLLTLHGHYSAALHEYAAAAANTTDAMEQARLEHRCALIHERRRDWTSSEAHIEAALVALPSGSGSHLRARLHTDRALLAHRREERVLAETEARHALELATEAEAHDVHAHALNLLGMLARSHGQVDEAVSHLERSLEMAEALDTLEPQVAALNNLALARADQDEVPLALELAKQALALCRRHGDRHREAAILNNLGDLLHQHGQHEESSRYIRAAVAIFADIGEPDRHEPEIWKLIDW